MELAVPHRQAVHVVVHLHQVMEILATVVHVVVEEKYNAAAFALA